MLKLNLQYFGHLMWRSIWKRPRFFPLLFNTETFQTHTFHKSSWVQNTSPTEALKNQFTIVLEEGKWCQVKEWKGSFFCSEKEAMTRMGERPWTLGQATWGLTLLSILTGLGSWATYFNFLILNFFPCEMEIITQTSQSFPVFDLRWNSISFTIMRIIPEMPTNNLWLTN